VSNRVELIHAPDCPNVGLARERLTRAFESAGCRPSGASGTRITPRALTTRATTRRPQSWSMGRMCQQMTLHCWMPNHAGCTPARMDA